MTEARPVALVTGGCRRLGGVIAARLAAAGWDLALHARRCVSPEPEVLAAIEDARVDWEVFEADLSDLAAPQRLMMQVRGRWPCGPTLLVNSAAAFGQDRLADTTAQDLMSHYAVNCASPALLIQEFAAPGAGDEAGRRSVVNILDQRIERPHGDQLAYTLSKIALAGLTRIAARELAPAIRVNAVAPGLTMPTGDYDAALMARLAASMPLARLPAPGDIADAVLFLADARAVTAQTLFVDAGARLKSWPRDFMHL